MSKPIYFFTKADRYYELSNFYPQGFEEEDRYWPSVEHYFQAKKFEDLDYQERIRTASSPKQAKDLGRTRAVSIRANWDQTRDEVMKHALMQKFREPALRKVLLGTKKRELIENSPYDRYWGCGRDGKGKNRLGILLMEVRDELSADA